jgi:hypothetical protein
MSQLRRGMLSYQRMGCWQAGQWEPGWTIDWRRGMREMQTFRKLPKRRPRANPISSAVWRVTI